MAEDASAPALKEIFNRAFFEGFARDLAAVYPKFGQARFLQLVRTGLEPLSIMQRVSHATAALGETLPPKYPAALKVLDALSERLRPGFSTLILPDFVARFGQEHWDLSMAALERYTQLGSAEFAIRHFLLRDLPRGLRQLEVWSRHQNEHVRRLASEGSRPRLPWSFRLTAVQQDPSLAAPILEALRADGSLYVRKSVANHLNDIGKDHPEYLLQLLRGWPREQRETAWIAKRALRTLIKAGHPEALALIGAGEPARVAMLGFRVSPSRLKLGGSLTLEAEFRSTASQPQRLVVDYAIHYVKQRGGTAPKVFKWKELDVAPGETVVLRRSQAIRPFTTRVHYAGEHRVELTINGAVQAETAFHLTV